MKNNGQCYLWIPSILTLSTLNNEAVQLINLVHSQISKPLVTTSTQNPYIMLLNDLSLGGASFTRDAEPGLAVCGPIINFKYISLDYISLIVAFGGDVEGLPVFFELNNLGNNVPVSFPDRIYIDEDKVEHIHTWETWGVYEQSHKPVKIENKWYRSNCYNATGTHLNASQWIDYRNSGGKVLSKDEYIAIQQINI